MYSQTTTSTSQEFTGIPIVKNRFLVCYFFFLIKMSLIIQSFRWDIMHSWPHSATHKCTQVWLGSCQPGKSPAWRSTPYWHLMFRSQLGRAITQTQGWTASLILRGVHVPGGMAAGLCVWAADSCRIPRCSLRSDKIKQARKTRWEEWWGWSPSGQWERQPARRSK